jgi:hypothetical protein
MPCPVNERPRIWMRNGVWQCGDYGYPGSFWVIATGRTPCEAYKKWKWTFDHARPYLQ